MTKPILNRALRRALLLSLSVPPLAACGGNVVVDGTGGASTGTFTDTGTSGTFTTFTTTTTSTAPCALLSTTPIGSTNGGCTEQFAIAGTPASCGAPGGGALPLGECLSLCPLNPAMLKAMSCSVSTPTVGPPGGAVLSCIYSLCGTGRRPPGLVPARDEGPAPVARFLGQVAHLEAAAVVAFERLADELQAHGAPEQLVRAARRSAREEVRHARVTRRFAEQAGARPEPVAVEGAPSLRSLEALAVDNAVEGCVRETFGALVAMHQAERARDPEMCRAMETIAREETRHAELSWELARWLDEQLDAAARRRVRDERDRAVEGLLRELGAEPHPSLVAELGVPTGAQARAAAAELCASLWS